MTIATIHQRFSPGDLLALDATDLYELVDGQLVEKKMSELANETAVYISSALFTHVRSGNLGRVLAEQTFQCFPHDPNRVRRPDVAFIAADRLPVERFDGHIPIAPDIAIEVVSPTDRFYDLEEKLSDYRQARVKLVWVVHPELRTILVHRANGTITRLFEQDFLAGETVLPTFACKIIDLLPSIQSSTKQT